MDGSGDVMDDALEDIAYLSRSENRVAILDALATRSQPRHELRELTGASRTTLGRILGELEQRGWVERAPGGNYVATASGKHVANEFMPLVGAMRTIRTLGDAVGLLPTDELWIDLRHFRDATVRRPNPNAPLEIDGYMADLLAQATSFHTLTFLAPPTATATAMQAGVLDDRLSAVHVLAGGLVGYLQNNPRGPPDWLEYIRAGADVYRYDGHIPCNLFVMDETVFIENNQADRERVGMVIESQNGPVRSWALDLVETYRRDAEPVGAEVFE